MPKSPAALVGHDGSSGSLRVFLMPVHESVIAPILKIADAEISIFICLGSILYPCFTLKAKITNVMAESVAEVIPAKNGMVPVDGASDSCCLRC